MILVNRTYQVVTEESTQDGEAAESGFDYDQQPQTYRELVDLMREHPHASASHPTGGTHEWLSSESERDMSDGSETTYSLHYSTANKPHNARYWRLAMVAAGIVKT